MKTKEPAAKLICHLEERCVCWAHRGIHFLPGMDEAADRTGYYLGTPGHWEFCGYGNSPLLRAVKRLRDPSC